MLKQRAQIIATAVLLCDLGLISAAFLGAHWLRNRFLFDVGFFSGGTYPLVKHLPLLPLSLGIWAALLLGSGVYRSHRTVPFGREAAGLLRTSLLSGLLFTLILYFFRLDHRLLADNQLSRAWITLFIVVSFLVLLVEKLTLRGAAHLLRERGFNYRNILVIGTSSTAKAVLDSIERNRYWGLRVVGVTPMFGRTRLDSFDKGPVFDNNDLVSLSEELSVDEVIVTEPVQEDEAEKTLLALNERGILIRFAVNPLPSGAGLLSIGDLDGTPLLSLSRTPTNAWVLLLKRALDIVVSAAALLAALPILVATAVSIKLSSKGDVIFRQTRSGLNGRPFEILKFRTMIEGAAEERDKLDHLNEVDGPVFKIRNDPRVTKAGRFLRRFSLDELPQLWNVLKGDMSLVGPRPPTPEEVVHYEAWQRRRLSMRPGITCLWQVGGRSNVDFDRWMKLDLEYIDNWSPWLDVKILLRTVPAVLSGRGAS